MRICCESYAEHLAYLEDDLDELAVEFGELTEDFPVPDSSFRAFLAQDRNAVNALLKLDGNVQGEYFHEVREALKRANELVETVAECRLSALLLAGYSGAEADAVIQAGRGELAEVKAALWQNFTEEQAQFLRENPLEEFYTNRR